MTNIFKTTIVDGIKISWCKQLIEDDLDKQKTRIRIHSIIDPDRETPACRISNDGFEYIVPEIAEYPEPMGLIVFGRDKWSRFTIDEVIEQYPEYESVFEKFFELCQESIAAAALGRKGGSVKSDRKAAAARENGKKGGRPSKK